MSAAAEMQMLLVCKETRSHLDVGQVLQQLYRLLMLSAHLHNLQHISKQIATVLVHLHHKPKQTEVVLGSMFKKDRGPCHVKLSALDSTQHVALTNV